ncbi:hypothetical protein H4R34_001697 [Dimargaris verticillata]|uniref:DinB-like domain-containing protein n=1 Tax=Dimargaris verticillata TaxID=2761393 RepID=A0A9W8EA14_9FUNG|nr:hypothetical protein H4R34_001697 [Dimargaris verticillata]
MATTDRALVIDGSKGLLTQGLDLLSSFADPALYSQKSALIPGSTIGKHFRHLYDHFRLLFEALPPTGPAVIAHDTAPAVYYDKRDRQVPMEHDIAVAMARIGELVECLQVLHENSAVDFYQPVTVRAQINPQTEHQPELPSSLGRELWFCAHHAIHHYAMIKVLCLEFGVPTATDFGVAPSTIQHHQATVAKGDA